MTTPTRIDAVRSQTDPLTAALAAALRPIIREELQQALARLAPAGHADPPTLSVKACAAATGMGEEAIRRVLAQHPYLRTKVGVKLLVRWPAFREWLEAQRDIPGAENRQQGRRRRVG